MSDTAPGREAPATPFLRDPVLEAVREAEGDPEANLPAVAEETDLVAIDLMASRLLRAHRHVARRRQHLAELHKAEAAALADRFERLDHPLLRQTEALEHALRLIADSVPYPKGRATRQVHGGDYGLRKVPASLEVQDPDAVIAWAKVALVEAVVEVPATAKLDRRVLATYFRSEGEVPPGTALKPESTTLVLRYAEGGAEG